MRSKVQRGAGRHRKIVTSQTAKGRIAVMTVAAGAVSTAGVGGAAAANIQSDDAATTKTQSVDFELASDSTQVEDAAAAPVDATPQILNVAEAKPVADLTDQLNKAIQASEERAAADEAARAPSVARPAEGAFTSPFAMRWGPSTRASTSPTLPAPQSLPSWMVRSSTPVQLPALASGSASCTTTAP